MLFKLYRIYLFMFLYDEIIFIMINATKQITVCDLFKEIINHVPRQVDNLTWNSSHRNGNGNLFNVPSLLWANPNNINNILHIIEGNNIPYQLIQTKEEFSEVIKAYEPNEFPHEKLGFQLNKPNYGIKIKHV